MRPSFQERGRASPRSSRAPEGAPLAARAELAATHPTRNTSFTALAYDGNVPGRDCTGHVRGRDMCQGNVTETNQNPRGIAWDFDASSHRTARSLESVDELPPWRQLIPLGLRHVLAMYAGAVAVPLVVGGALIGAGKLNPGDLGYLVTAD